MCLCVRAQGPDLCRSTPPPAQGCLELCPAFRLPPTHSIALTNPAAQRRRAVGTSHVSRWAQAHVDSANTPHKASPMREGFAWGTPEAKSMGESSSSLLSVWISSFILPRQEMPTDIAADSRASVRSTNPTPERSAEKAFFKSPLPRPAALRTKTLTSHPPVLSSVCGDVGVRHQAVAAKKTKQVTPFESRQRRLPRTNVRVSVSLVTSWTGALVFFLHHVSLVDDDIVSLDGLEVVERGGSPCSTREPLTV